MMFKILLISSLILIFIGIINGGINGGINDTCDTDEQSLLFWADVDKISDNINGESSTAVVNNVAMDEKMWEKWTQETFLREYRLDTINNFWNDLRNEAYVDSWPILCYLLWAKNTNNKRGQECSASRMYEPLLPRYTYRVEIPNQNRYQVDLLQCKCPKNPSLSRRVQTVTYSGLYFFVTPCAVFNNSYYIMRQIHRGTLEVYDIRDTAFSPNLDYNLRASEYDSNVQTYGQPGRVATENELMVEEKIEKWAQESFMRDYACCTNETFIWPELRSKAYVQSWPTLCLLLLDRDPNTKTTKKCNVTEFSEVHNSRMAHRVVNPPDNIRIYADILLCQCPESIRFYVTKSHSINNTYYMMRMNPGQIFELKVYDRRCIVFNPNFSNTL